MREPGRGRLAALVLTLLSWLWSNLSCAEGPARLGQNAPASVTHRDSFETDAATWVVSAETAATARLRLQQRSTGQIHSGARAEQIQLDLLQSEERVFIEQFVPAAMVFDELTARVWVRANRTGVKLGVRIVLPRQLDPRTNRPVTADLFGMEYTTPREWQQLVCRTGEAEVRQWLGRQRAQLARSLGTPQLNTDGLYVDRVVLSISGAAGPYELFLDDLELGPLIDPASNGATIVQVGGEAAPTPPITLGDGRLIRNGRPYFVRATPYHGEDPALLRQLGFNLAWVPDYRDQTLLNALSAQGIGGMAKPPAEAVDPVEAGVSQARYNVGIPSFTRETEHILIWTLGCEVRPEALASVRAAADAVRDADPYRRPVFADVSGHAREFHRSLDLLGVSRHSIHTTISPLEYASWLERAQLEALRGKPTFTWVFIEPNAAQVASRPPGASPPVVEFEQILMQVYAAIGAGCKGIGFWKHGSLADDSPLGVERRNSVLIANLQLQLLDRWIAAGKVADLAPVRLGEGVLPGSRGMNQTLFTRYNRLAGDTRPPDQLAAQVRAPVLRSDAGVLVLPHWLEPNGQYQPGAMSANDVRILLRGEEAPHAWIITPTGIHPYQVRCKTDASGGTEIALERFEQAAAIILTQDLTVVEDLRRQVQQTSLLAGPAYVELAQARLQRVQEVHDELQRLSPKPIKDGDYLLAEARRELRTAEQELKSGNFDGARVTSERVLKLTRIVMRAHWDAAVESLTSPVATPYTISFQTLPDYWRLVQSLSRGRPSAENLLPGGDFEHWNNITYPGGWDYRRPPERELWRAAVELSPGGVSGRALRLVAWPTDPQHVPPVISESPIQFVSPPIPVYSGQIVHVRGQVRIETPVLGSADGLMIYDNLVGTVGALRWGADAPRGRWVPFELLRPVQRSGDFQLVLELTGLGDVRIDELQVKTIQVE